MKTLNRMLLRDVREHKAQLIAVGVVLMFGVFSFLATYISYVNINKSAEFYYDEYRFLDYYALANHIDDSTARTLAKQDGVIAAEPRISEEARIDVGETRVSVKVNSLPADREPNVNRLYYFEGKAPQAGKNQCLVSSTLQEFHKLEIGQEIELIAEGKVTTLQISGVVGSPEYIYEVSGASSLYSVPGDYGIIYLNQDFMQNMFGYSGAYNEVHFLLEPAVAERTIDRIEEQLDTSGFIAGIERKDQISNSMLRSEIDQLENMAVLFPLLFMSISVFMLYIMMKRTIQNQRITLGTMKALGLYRKDILLYYMKLGGISGLFGSIFGAILGSYGGVALNEYYTLYFHIPVMSVDTKPLLIAMAIGGGLGVTLLGSYLAGRTAFALRPAEAMRPAAPETVTGFDYEEKLGRIWHRVPFGWKMVIRNIGRKKFRTGATALGVCFTVIMLLVSMFMGDTTDNLVQKNFHEYQKYDIKANFIAPVSFQDISPLADIEGVRTIEPVLDMGVKLTFKGEEKDILLSGVKPDTEMVTLRDQKGRTLSIPSSGVIMPASYAESMGIKLGDIINLEPYDKRLDEKQVVVVALAEQYMDFSTYADIEYLGRLFDDSRHATGIFITAEEEHYMTIEDELQEYPYVQSVNNRAEMVAWLEDMMGFTDVYMGVMLMISGIIGFAIIFNSTLINIAERKRELASLRVLGYRIKEIKRMLGRENMLVAVLALVPGIYFGYRISLLFGETFTNDMYNLVIIISPQSYMITIVSTLFFVWFAGVAVRSRIHNLDMVEVLKDREG
jgi:putative ABC transport system permease protein